MLFLPEATGKVQHFTESIQICLTKFKKMIRFIINKKSNAVRKMCYSVKKRFSEQSFNFVMSKITSCYC